jgi:hypothetical protein
MSRNPYRVFKEIFPDAPLQVGQVTAVGGGAATVTLPGGGVLQARGAATVGQRVFVRDGVIEGAAPDLPIVLIEV